ncbi:MAG: flagellar basal body-associated FliL family protein [Desulfovibrio sp.]|nr:flagellar basal body-associated FliL family protein [Desulfovibrio sp.]
MPEEQMVKDTPTKEEMSVVVAGQEDTRKVELDLEDAPFLKEEPSEAPAIKAQDNPDGSQASSESAPVSGKKKKKLFLLVGVGVFALLAVGGAVWWFLLRSPAPPPPPVIPIEPEVIVVPSAPSAPTPKPESIKELEAFIIPRQTQRGTHFLVCKFSTISTDPTVDTEIDHKLIPLRDALYYYLSSKSDDFLLNAGNATKIKEDLAAVLNHYITRGKIEDILFESYLNE